MKTSNIIFVAAGLVLLGSIIWYDRLLKAEFDTGRYKVPYSTYDSLDFSGFDQVNVEGSTASNVKFVHGPYSVRVEKNALSYTRITRNGRLLKIQTVFEHRFRSNPNDYIVIIACPVLRKVSTGASYRADGRRITDSVSRPDWAMRSCLIEGFDQDSLAVFQEYGSTVVLSENRLKNLSATIGTAAASGSRFVIETGNSVDTARIDVQNKSQFIVKSSSIRDFSYRLADSATISLNGTAQHLLTTSKPWYK